MTNASDPLGIAPRRDDARRSRLGGPLLWTGQILLVAAVYFAAAKLGLSLASLVEQVSAVWPPTGIALAAVLVFGYRVWPGIALGAFLANATAHESVAVACGIAAGNTLEALVGAWLLRNVARFDIALRRVRDVVALIVLSAVVSTAICATVGVTSLCLGGIEPWSNFSRPWFEWWLGDAMGALVMAPVLLTWAAAKRERWWRRPTEGVALLASLIGTSLIIFAARTVPGNIPYIIFPFVVWAALRFEQRGATTVTFVASALAIWGTVRGSGPFGIGPADERLLMLQLFMGVVAVTSLLLGAALAERRRSEAIKRTSEEVTRVLAESSTLLEAAPRMIDIICEGFGLRLGAFWRVDSSAHVLRCVDVRHYGTVPRHEFEAATRQAAFEKGVGLPGRVWNGGAPAWIPDVVEDPNFPRAVVASGEGLHGAFAFPIKLGGEVLGVIEFFSSSIRQPDDDVLRMMAAIGSQIGQFIERKRSEEALRESSEWTKSIIATAYDAFIAMDAEGCIIDWNARAEATLGWSREEAMGRKLVDTIIPPRYHSAHKQGLQNFLATGEGPVLGRQIELFALHRDGHEIPMELMVSAVRSGKSFFFSAFLHDVAQRKRTEDTFRFLAEASASLATLVDYESTLRKVARLSVGIFADWCAVDVLKQDGVLRRLTAEHAEPEKVRFAQELMLRGPASLEQRGILHHVLRTGKSELVADVSKSMQDNSMGDMEHPLLLALPDVKSFICVLLAPHGKPMGVVTFAMAESNRRYGPEDLEIAEDIVHRTAVAIDNSNLYAELREADRRKDEFLAMLAHELRNPLAPIRSGLDLISIEGIDAETAEWARVTMKEQVVHMVRLVDDLLDVSRIMRGKIQLRRELVQISPVVARAVEEARPLIDSREHRLEVELPAEPIWIHGDPVRLAQVLANLLNNAAKYTNPGGQIGLSVSRRDGEVMLRVKDNGIGLAPEMQGRVFDLFAQADISMERTQGGLGIGLTVVKNLVEMHGGSVDVFSDGLGQGSEFTVRLPAASEHSMEANEQGEPPALRDPSTNRHRVLVVDDNADAAAMLSALLTAWGQEVRVAADGSKAIQAVDLWRPDIVLLDIGLPGMSGYDVARELRRTPAGENLLLVALTGYGKEEDRRRSQDAGFDLHLVKPPSESDLRSVLRRSRPPLAKA